MRAILTFQGFTESSERRTGTEDLYWQVIRLFSSDTVTTDWPRMWTANTKALASLLSRQRIASVAMVSYSHGQAAACDFARACYELGINVDLWLACDPVYRPAWLPRHTALQPLAFRALTRSAVIKVPHNIKRVASVRQRINRPQGHDLIPTSPKTVIAHPIQLPFPHTDIDHSAVWFDLVYRELNAWTNSIP